MFVSLVTELVEKKFMRSGPADVNFEDIDVLPLITEETVQFIDDHAKASKKGEPFFIYFPLNAPHTPARILKDIQIVSEN